MGRTVGWMALAGWAVAMAPQSQAPAPPQFRGGTEIVAIDFLATRPDGQPIADLTAKDITLKVDGRVREVKSFQFVKLSATSREARTAAPTLPLPFGSNDGPTPGRIVIIVVDHESIRASEAKNATLAAGRFLDRLTPLDRVALVTMPNGKVEADLTTNHERVRAALATVVGRAQRNRAGISNVSVDEAMTVLAETLDPDKKFTNELIDRECKFAGQDSACRKRVVQDALQMVRDIETQTRGSLLALKDFFNGLASVEGPKSILYLSGQLVSFPETRLDLEEVGRAAARARAQMFVIQPHDTLADAGVRDSPPSLTADINQRITGLENLAGITGGELFRMSGMGDLVFGRIADQISSHYLLGFEPRADERNGKPHKVEIETARKDVDIRARPMFIVDDPRNAPPPPAVLETLLRDFATYRDLPLRAVAHVVRDVDPNMIKVVTVVEPIDPAATLNAVAYALVNLRGQAAAEWSENGAGVVTRPLITAAVVPPGDYRLRVVASDINGRRGAVDYEFSATLTDTPPLSLSSLMVGVSEQGSFRPRLVVSNEPAVMGYAEFYATLPSGTAVTARFEIADSADGPAIARAPGDVQGAAVATRFVVSGAVPLAKVSPGDHLLRVVLSINDKPAGRILRTFRKIPQ